MTRVHLTAVNLKSLPAKTDRQRADYTDSVQPGLVLRVSPAGERVFSCRFRTRGGRAGRVERFTLGSIDELDLASARRRAREVLADVRRGVNPAADLRAERAALRAAATASTAQMKLRDLFGECLSDVGRELRPATLRSYETARRQLEALRLPDQPAFGLRAANTIEAADVRLVGKTLARHAPVAANRVLAFLSRAFTWAVAQGIVPRNPCLGVPKPTEEEASQRVLSVEELKALMNALDGLPAVDESVTDTAQGERILSAAHVDVVWLLLFTCARLAMILGARVSEFEDLDGAEPRLVIPGGRHGRSKNKLPHVVPLSPAALVVVRRRIEASRGGLLFPARGVDQPMTWGNDFATALRARVQAHLGEVTVEPWTIHNLRHTIATHLEEDLKVGAPVVSRLLAHIQRQDGTPAVTARYARATLLAERRAALVAWAAWLERLRQDSPMEAAKVVPLARG